MSVMFIKRLDFQSQGQERDLEEQGHQLTHKLLKQAYTTSKGIPVSAVPPAPLRL